MKMKILNLALPTAILLLQFQLVFVFQYPVTIGLIALPLVVWTLFKPQLNILSVLIIVLILGQTTLVFFVSNSEEPVQFVRTLLLVLSGLFVTLISLSSTVRFPDKLLIQAIRNVFLLLTIFSGIQFLFARNLPVLNKPFGSFTNYFAIINSNYGEITRASAFFNEPSYNALVACSFIPFIYFSYTGKKRSIFLSIGMLYVFFTYSIAGIFVYFIVISVNLFTKGNSKPILLLTFPIFVYSLNDYFFERATTFDVAGSSANFRFVAPVNALKSIIPDNPFGIELGTLEKYMLDLGNLNGSTVGTSLDNGIFLIMLYFGLSGIVLIGTVVLIAILRTKRMVNRGYKDWIIIFIPLILPVFTGAIFTPEFILLLMFSIFFIRAHEKRYLQLKVNYE